MSSEAILQPSLGSTGRNRRMLALHVGVKCMPALYYQPCSLILRCARQHPAGKCTLKAILSGNTTSRVLTMRIYIWVTKVNICLFLLFHPLFGLEIYETFSFSFGYGFKTLMEIWESLEAKMWKRAPNFHLCFYFISN